MKITQEFLRENFEYREDGLFISRKPTSNGKRRLGFVIEGYLDRVGYRIISIGNVNRKYHRMIFLYHYGWLPKNIDHINRIKSDCRIENLRAATTSQNMLNVNKFKKNASSKFKGVSFHIVMKKFIARLRYNGELIHLGYFKEEKDAASAYDKKAREIFGDFAVVNFS